MNATTVSGSVIVSTTEVARGSTVTGTVDVEMGSDDWRELEFSTVSGDIIIRLPDGLDTARITVEPPREAAHGDLSTNAAMVLDALMTSSLL